MDSIKWSVSIDPGLVNMGLAIFRGTDLYYGETVNLKERYNLGGKPKIEHLTRSIIDWISTVPQLGYQNVRVIIEDNTINVTHNFAGIIAGVLLCQIPSASVYLVYPMSVASFFKVRGTRRLERASKKRETYLRVRKYFHTNLPHNSYDLADACENFLYVHLRVFSKPPLKNPWDRLLIDHAIPQRPVDDTISINSCQYFTTGTVPSEVDFVPSGGDNPSGSHLRFDIRPVDYQHDR